MKWNCFDINSVYCSVGWGSRIHRLLLCWRVRLLYFDLQPGQTCHSKVMLRKEMTHSYGQKSKEIAWADLADELRQGRNSHGTLIDWCTGREWPVNRITVISAWCHSKDWVGDWVGVKLLYNSVKTGSQTVGVQRSCWWDVVEKARRRGPLEPLMSWGSET